VRRIGPCRRGGNRLFHVFGGPGGSAGDARLLIGLRLNGKMLQLHGTDGGRERASSALSFSRGAGIHFVRALPVAALLTRSIATSAVLAAALAVHRPGDRRQAHNWSAAFTSAERRALQRLVGSRLFSAAFGGGVSRHLSASSPLSLSALLHGLVSRILSSRILSSRILSSWILSSWILSSRICPAELSC